MSRGDELQSRWLSSFLSTGSSYDIVRSKMLPMNLTNCFLSAVNHKSACIDIELTSWEELVVPLRRILKSVCWWNGLPEMYAGLGIQRNAPYKEEVISLSEGCLKTDFKFHLVMENGVKIYLLQTETWWQWSHQWCWWKSKTNHFWSSFRVLVICSGIGIVILSLELLVGLNPETNNWQTFRIQTTVLSFSFSDQ